MTSQIMSKSLTKVLSLMVGVLTVGHVQKVLCLILKDKFKVEELNFKP